MIRFFASKIHLYGIFLVCLLAPIPTEGQSQKSRAKANQQQKAKQTIEYARSLYGTQPDSTILLTEQLLQTTAGEQSPESQSLEAEIRKTLSTALSLVGQNTRALQEGKKAARLYAQVPDTIGMGVAHANLGMIYFGISLYTEAAEEYGKALFYLKNRGKEAAIAGISNNLGNLWMVQNRYDQARSLYESALSTYRKLNIPSGVSYTINNIGVVNEKQKKYAAAIDCYLQALTIDEHENDLLGQVNGNLNLGDAFTETGRTQQADERYLKALAIAEKISDPQGIIRALLAMAEHDHRNGQQNRALMQARRAQALAESTGNKQNLDNLLGLLTDIAKAMGNDQQALVYQKQQLELLRETHQKEKQLAERNTKEQTEVRLIDALDNIQELNNDLSKQRTNYQTAIRVNVGLGTGLLFLLLLMGRYIRKQRSQQRIQLIERNRLEQEQEERQRQKLHNTQKEIYLEQKLQAQNISLFLKEISLHLSALNGHETGTPSEREQAHPKKPGERVAQLRSHIDDLILLIHIQHHPREFPPTQIEAGELISQALKGIGVAFKLKTHHGSLLIHTHPAIFYLMFRNLVEWVEAPCIHKERSLLPVHIELLKPINGLLPIQLRWVDYDPDLLNSVHQSVLQLSNRRFDWPQNIPGRPTLGGLAIVHQTLQQLGGQASMKMPKPNQGLSLQVLVPLQD